MNPPLHAFATDRLTTAARCWRPVYAMALLLLALAGLIAPPTAHAVVTAGIATSTSTPDVGGAAFSWTITLTNGASGVSNVVMTFPLPPGAKIASQPTIGGTAAGSFSCLGPAIGTQGTVVCEAPTMVASAVATIVVVAQYEADMAPGVRTAQARVVASGAESLASVQQTLQAAPVLTLSLAATPSVNAGGIVNLRAGVVNNANASAINAILRIALPTGLSFLGVYGSSDFHGTCSLVVSTNTVECTPRFVGSGFGFVTVVTRSSYDLPAGNLPSTATLSVTAPTTTVGSPVTVNTAITN